uniref:Vitamin D hydroxylase n=1 Tax=Pseudonocardia autotrophica TaxID=2074 RepID=UPI0001DD2100|nr:Chain A, Vitamin D hydroxylase [Pseudonocardia autotrophica]3A4Z_B Chain B, Vitamin D hydroxylase [Pseudonocardia autotrophica]3A4Z_C Chain C, Vitamin D hydroxylase [Pseudonocardia autotrophica]3A4Z_D Chain D, Vitamin D hydroxylase [Pseudonocardia autotrophica]3A4Z_E Chain E, Vitamin D hydroxylase [Pseudonocardia autotrophica]3A50_A Chain A, Vitamin D hydroxylase [Pseudonocardia autotrophica]3A50_B Chain B, Vitamin D hydroxylase [Pseudonocardia autotrophica]3A50_C Chain C, Vitamin D hydro
MALTTTGTEQHDLFSGTFWQNPHPAYAALRAEDPVRKLALPDGPVWLLTRYADVREAFVDPRLSKDWRHRLPEDQRADMPATPTPMMILMDPPDHTRLRKLVGRSFTVRRMNELEPRITEIADGLLAGLPTDGPVDLMREYAFQIPVQVICELLGLPAEDRDDFSAWSSVLVDDSPADDKNAAMGKLHGYLSDLLERKRTEPDDALLSSLLAVSDMDGDRLSQEELVAMAMLLLIAGHETTVNLIGNGVLALLTHPDQRKLLAEDPSLISSAVEEFLRFDSPVSQAPIRFTAEDVTYSGVTIPAGEMVMLGLAAANRDADWMPEPDRLDITRDASGGVFFGHGIHFCLGAQLARLEGRVAIGRLFADRPELALAVGLDELVYRRSTLVRGLSRMPVTMGPRSALEHHHHHH